MLMENTFTLFSGVVSEELGYSKDVVDTAYTILLVTDGLSGPVWGKLGVRYGVRPCIIAAFCLNVLMTGMLATRLNLITFYTSHVLEGMIAAAVFSPCVLAAVQLMPRSRQGFASAASTVSIVGVPAVVSVPVKLVLKDAGAHIAYIAQGVTSSSMLCFCFLCLPRLPTASEASQDSGSVVRLAEPRRKWLRVLVLYVAYLLMVSNYYFFEAQIQTVLEAFLPKGSPVLTFGLSACLFVNGVSRIIWGVAVQTFSVAVCLSVGSVFLAVSMNLMTLGMGSSVIVLILVLLCFGGVTAVWPLMPVLIARVFSHDEAMSLYALINTAGLLAGVFGGPVAAHTSCALGWPVTMCIFSALPLLAAVIVALALLREEVATAELEIPIATDAARPTPDFLNGQGGTPLTDLHD